MRIVTSVYYLESFFISNPSYAIICQVDNKEVSIEKDQIWQGKKQINDNVLQLFYPIFKNCFY